MSTFLIILATSLLAGGGMYLGMREQVKNAENKKQELIELLLETRDLLDECEGQLVAKEKHQARQLSLQGEPVPLKLVIKQSVA